MLKTKDLSNNEVEEVVGGESIPTFDPEIKPTTFEPEIEFDIFTKSCNVIDLVVKNGYCFDIKKGKYDYCQNCMYNK